MHTKWENSLKFWVLGFLGFLVFNCIVWQLNEMTNLISITTGFVRSESQTLHSAPLLPLIGTARLSWTGKLIMQEAVQNPFPISTLCFLIAAGLEVLDWKQQYLVFWHCQVVHQCWHKYCIQSLSLCFTVSTKIEAWIGNQRRVKRFPNTKIFRLRC